MYVEALNEAIREEMENDEAVYYMGEDVRASIYGHQKIYLINLEKTEFLIRHYLKMVL